MTQQPLTPAGVQAKQNELYALSSTDLANQAALIRDDFKSWLSTNFSLTQTQAAFLNTIPQTWMRPAADDTANAIVNKFPITLNANTPPPSYISKMVKHSYTFDGEFASNSPFTASGTLSFSIVYS